MPEYRRSPERVSQLTDQQYRVTQQDETEPSFANAYWDNKAAGIYVDVVSGEPLFASVDKYESRTGWPSFTKPLDAGHVVERPDTGHGMVRVEVRSAQGDSHLGHLFPDGPDDRGGLRYCVNSASLRFIPVAELEREGYSQYLSVFGASEEGAAGLPAPAGQAAAPTGPASRQEDRTATRNRDGASAVDGAHVPAEQIAAAVTAGSIVYSDGATQSFDPGGATRYTEHGRETAGTWSVDEDGHFCSFWPPDYRASYELRWVVEDAHVVGLRFSDLKGGARFDGRYR